MSFHSFNVDVAKEYGVNVAVILQNLLFWTEKKRANCQLEGDGLAYIYNSILAWQKLFPYLSEKQIRGALNTLENDGFIVSRQDLNRSSMDRTKHYALTEKALHKWLNINEINGQMQDDKKVDCILTKGQMDSDKRADAIEPKVQLLTDNKHTDINTDNKHIKKIPKKVLRPSDSPKLDKPPKLNAEFLAKNFGVDIQVAKDYLTTRKKPLTQTALNNLIKQFDKASLTYAEGFKLCAENGWQGFNAQWLINRENQGYANNTGTNQLNSGIETEQERIKRLSRSAAGRVQLNIEREQAFEQRRNAGVVVDYESDLWPPLGE